MAPHNPKGPVLSALVSATLTLFLVSELLSIMSCELDTLNNSHLIYAELATLLNVHRAL